MSIPGKQSLFCSLLILLVTAGCGGALKTTDPSTVQLPPPEAADTDAGPGSDPLTVEEPVGEGDAGDQPEFLAVVNGENVPFAYLEQRLATMHSEQTENQRSAYDIDRLMFKVVNDILLAQEARAVEMDREQPIKGQED